MKTVTKAEFQIPVPMSIMGLPSDCGVVVGYARYGMTETILGLRE